MKPRIPRYTLVKRPAEVRLRAELSAGAVPATGRRKRERALSPFLRDLVSQKGGEVDITPASPPDEVWRSVMGETAVAGQVFTVGLLDLGAWVSALPQLLERLNGAQSRYRFFEIQTPVPAGLIKTREPLLAWAREHGAEISEETAAALERNMLGDEFFFFAAPVREEYDLSVLIGLTAARVAFTEDDGSAKWDYFVAGRGNVSLVSTADLRGYAREAGRPYEAAVGMLIVAEALTCRFKIQYHNETRGCIFDFDDNRDDIVASLKSMSIDEQCQELIPDLEEADAVHALLTVLGSMKEA